MRNQVFQIPQWIAKEKLGTEQQSDDTKALIRKLRDLTTSGQICKNVNSEYKIPFFRLYSEST
jgi:hypothetical protein